MPPWAFALRTPGAAWPRAFTLVELMTMIGLIAFLVSILLPAVQAAREGAAQTACLTNLHLLGVAIHQYLNDNRETLPDASSSNSWDSPYSPRGLADRGFKGYGAYEELGAAGKRTDPAFGAGAKCLPPICQLLDRYVAEGGKIWRCPTQRDPQSFVKMRSGHFAYSPGGDATYGETGEFRPGYLYLSTKEYQWFIAAEPEMAAKYWMYDWIVRNIGGMGARAVVGFGPRATSSDVALFIEYDSRLHTKPGTPDVYSVVQSDPSAPVRAPGKYATNVLFLDGHVDTVQYRWQGGLVQQMHAPIPQVQYGMSFESVYAENYRREYIVP